MNETEYTLIEEMLPLLVSHGKGDFTPEQREAARKFMRFVDHLPGGFLIYRAQAGEEIIYANKALVSMYECKTVEEFIEFTGNSFKGLVYQEDYEDVVKSISQQITDEGDDLDYVEYRILTKKGNMRYVEDYGHYIKTNVGNMYYVFITDATVKNAKKQQELVQRLEVIEGLSENYDSILYVDLDDDSVFPYRMSKRLTKQFDGKMQPKAYSWMAEDFVNSWVHPDDQQRIRTILSPDYIRKTLTGKGYFYEHFRCLFGKELQYMQLRVVDVKHTGHISQVVIGSRNIEEEIKQEMKQKTLLENALKDSRLANSTKSAFLSNISHDMRTPLNALFGYIELAKKHISEKEALEKYLNNVNAAGIQLLDLVDKVLEISYLESKDFQLSESLCNIKELTTEIYEELLPTAQKKSLDFTFEHPVLVHPEVFTDGEQLKQVLLNIASNGIKYTPGGGRVQCIMEECLSTSSEFATFRFTVRDTGVGISADALKKIFEPFEREYNSTYSGVFGSGLGLTIAKQIVDRMGGTITAESQVGEGSIFTVTLSFKLSGKTEKISDTSDVEAFIKNKKILLVEDNEFNLEIATEILQDLGLTVEPAENGQIAVDKVKSSKPHEYLFILMDIQMPVMDGWQATEEIRSLNNPDLATIPIIALSANAFESDKRLSAKYGMNAHLNKPLDVSALLHSIKKTVMHK